MRPDKWFLFFMAVLAFFFFSCRTKPGQEGDQLGVYYWKTTLDFDKNDQAFADSLGLSKFYLRYFDVDWSPSRNMAVPLGELNLDWDHPALRIENYQLIPVVYLTNRVFEQDADVKGLARKITEKVKSLNESIGRSVYSAGWNEKDNQLAEMPEEELYQQLDTVHARFLKNIREIQIDCDWTATTRERYFEFLSAMQAENAGWEISFTLRLHQFRDRKSAGIPPLKKAVLMCYNVAPVHEFQTANAIFDADLIEGYLREGRYPLELDAALPLFSWGALFHENRFKGLASGLTRQDVEGNPLYDRVNGNLYRFKQDTVLYDQFMREGDIVRVDGPDPEGLKKIAQRLSEIKNIHSLVFFDWNPEKIKEYHVYEINQDFQHAR